MDESETLAIIEGKEYNAKKSYEGIPIYETLSPIYVEGVKIGTLAVFYSLEGTNILIRKVSLIALLVLFLLFATHGIMTAVIINKNNKIERLAYYDSYGHNVGDMAIKRFGQMLSKLVRKDGDWVARYGGEEFLICLPNTDNKKARIVLERIRRAIEKMEIVVEDKEIQVTGSFGLYTIENCETTACDLIKYTDDNLYKAKENGRNRIVS